MTLEGLLIQEGVDNSGKFAQQVQEQLEDFLFYNRFDDAEAIQKLTGITALPETVQNVYRRIMGSELFCYHRLGFIQRKTGIAFKADMVQRKYATLVRQVDLGKLKELREETGIEPQLTEQDAEIGYKECLRKSYDFKDFSALRESIGIGPSAQLLQSFYTYYIENGYIDAVKKLQSITGISWEVSESFVQKKYADWVTYSTRFSAIQGLYEVTGIKPDLAAEVVQKAYLNFLYNGRLVDEGRYGGVQVLKELTQIPLSLPEEWVQLTNNAYSYDINEQRFSNFVALYDACGLQPNLSPEQLDELNKHAETHIAKNWWLLDIKRVYEILQRKAEVSQTLVQEKYKEAATSKHFHKIQEIYDLTGTKPSEEVCQLLVNQLVA